MASSASFLLQNFPRHRSVAVRTISCTLEHHRAGEVKPQILSLPGRRQCLFLLTASPAIAGIQSSVLAQDIPIFGLRKKLQKVEEEALEIVKEGEAVVGKEIQAAEKEIEAAEKEIVKAEKEIESVTELGLSGQFTQAGVVAGAEFLGIVVATSIVNGILGPEGQKS